MINVRMLFSKEDLSEFSKTLMFDADVKGFAKVKLRNGEEQHIDYSIDDTDGIRFHDNQRTMSWYPDGSSFSNRNLDIIELL